MAWDAFPDGNMLLCMRPVWNISYHMMHIGTISNCADSLYDGYNDKYSVLTFNASIRCGFTNRGDKTDGVWNAPILLPCFLLGWKIQIDKYITPLQYVTLIICLWDIDQKRRSVMCLMKTAGSSLVHPLACQEHLPCSFAFKYLFPFLPPMQF